MISATQTRAPAGMKNARPPAVSESRQEKGKGRKEHRAPAPHDNDWIGVDEVAHLLHVDRRTVYNRLNCDPNFPRPHRYLKNLRWVRGEVLAYKAEIEKVHRIEFGEKLPASARLSAGRDRYHQGKRSQRILERAK